MPKNTPKDMPENDVIEDDSEEMASETEQDQYDMLVSRAMKLMHGSSKEDILRMLGSGDSPAQTMGQAAAMLVKGLADAAKNAGTEIAPEVIMNAGIEIVELLSELGQAGGVFEFASKEEEDSEMQDAVLWGVKYYGDGMNAAGELTPELKKAAQEEVQAGLASEGTQIAPLPTQKPAQRQEAPRDGLIDSLMESGVQ